MTSNIDIHVSMPDVGAHGAIIFCWISALWSMLIMTLIYALISLLNLLTDVLLRYASFKMRNSLFWEMNFNFIQRFYLEFPVSYWSLIFASLTLARDLGGRLLEKGSRGAVWRLVNLTISADWAAMWVVVPVSGRCSSSSPVTDSTSSSSSSSSSLISMSTPCAFK